MSEFKELCRFINSNKVILRSDLQHYLNLHMKTCDPYRRKLEVIGFIKKTGRGVYTRLKLIPDDYKTTDMVKDYDKAMIPIRKEIEKEFQKNYNNMSI